MLELAAHIVETKAGHFDPSKFENQYEDVLKELLKRSRKESRLNGQSELSPRAHATSGRYP
jgi:DNA end-binding protein Ku